MSTSYWLLRRLALLADDDVAENWLSCGFSLVNSENGACVAIADGKEILTIGGPAAARAIQMLASELHGEFSMSQYQEDFHSSSNGLKERHPAVPDSEMVISEYNEVTTLGEVRRKCRQ